MAVIFIDISLKKIVFKESVKNASKSADASKIPLIYFEFPVILF